MRACTLTRRLLATLCLTAITLAAAHAEELIPGTPLNLSLGANIEKNDLFIDVPAAATTLRLALKADNLADNIDLLITFGRPLDVANIPVENLTAAADYYSIGVDGDEHVAITKSENVPRLQAGRWYITAVNPLASTVNATLTATVQTGPLDPMLIDIDFDTDNADCDSGPWHDNTPFTPVNGNNATTLGEARRNALIRATELLSENLTSPVATRLLACWGRQSFNILASAGPTFIFSQSPGTGYANPNTYISAAPARRLAGTELCRVDPTVLCTDPDIVATFNPSQKWELGLTPMSNATGDPDFISTAMHEITHGLGFISFVDVQNGEKFNDFDDTFSNRVIYFNKGDPMRFADLTNSERFNAIKSKNQLRWDGPAAVASNRNIFASQDMGYPWLYAPAPVEPGSSLSHLHQNFPGSDLMGPVAIGKPRTPGISTAFLEDAGWGNEQTAVITPDPSRGLYWNRALNGHGFDLQRSGSNWFLLMYSYRDDNTPLWYLATGTVTNGVFSGTASQFDYDANRSTEKAQAIPGTGGPVTIDFSAASTANAAACQDGTDRSTATLLGVFNFDLDGTAGQWCVEPFQFGTGPAVTDFTGSWFNSTDSGWGLTIYTKQSATAGATDLVVVLYYYDADGMPRWALGVLLGADLSQEVTVDMSQFTGFCPTCTPVNPDSAQSGTVRLLLSSPSTTASSGNTANISVDFLGAPGGQWVRSDTDIQELSDLPD